MTFYVLSQVYTFSRFQSLPCLPLPGLGNFWDIEILLTCEISQRYAKAKYIANSTYGMLALSYQSECVGNNFFPTQNNADVETGVLDTLNF